MVFRAARTHPATILFETVEMGGKAKHRLRAAQSETHSSESHLLWGPGRTARGNLRARGRAPLDPPRADEDDPRHYGYLKGLDSICVIRVKQTL